MKSKLLIGAGALLMLVHTYLIFLSHRFNFIISLPTDVETGVIQRIFYMHVPLAWIAFLAFFIVLIGSIMYLWKRDFKWDRLSSASAEIGFLFISLMLITGCIWAKPVWGVWWVWDARLTMSLVLWFIYAAYLLIRAYITEDEQRARFSSIVGIIGFLDVPLVFLAVKLWKTQHTGLIIFEGGLVTDMVWTLIVGIAAYTILYVILLMKRVAIKNSQNDVNIIKNMVSGG